MRDELHEGRTTESIIGAFFAVYNELGFGLMESLYSRAMDRELRDRGHQVAREVSIQTFHKGLPANHRCITVQLRPEDSVYKFRHPDSRVVA